MTLKNQRFVDEYLIDLNQTQAAIRAGYSPRSAHNQGERLMKNAEVHTRIAEAMAELSKRTGVNQERVIRELARVAFINATDVINMSDATIKSDAGRDDTAAISSVKVKTIPTEEGEIVEREVKISDKLKALELLGKHLGMFTEKLDVTGKVVVFGGEDDIPD